MNIVTNNNKTFFFTDIITRKYDNIKYTTNKKNILAYYIKDGTNRLFPPLHTHPLCE